MPIYRLHEDTEEFRNVKKFDDEETSIASGNLFESLALSNPELFNKTKLMQLMSCENIVESFNQFMESIVSEKWFDSKLEKKNREKLKEELERTTDEISRTAKAKELQANLNKYYQTTNVLFFSAIRNEIEGFLNSSEGLTLEDAKRAIAERYIPDSLTVEGCRKLISIRLKKNQALTQSLTSMLKQNFTALNISEAEAKSLIGELENTDTNHQAIGKIKEFLQNPEKLKNFKLGANNYDFRKIGGSVVLLSDDDSIKFGAHPSKKIADIFKYDCIVVAHGGYDFRFKPEFSKKSKDASLTIINRYLLSAKKCKRAIIFLEDEDMEKYEYDKKFVNKFNELEKRFNELYRDFKNAFNDKDIEALENVKKKHKECYESIYDDSSFDDYSRRDNRIRLLYDTTNGDNYINFNEIPDSIDSIIDDIGKEDHGVEGEDYGDIWTTQPIDTLTTTGNTSIVKILRILKKEGFKNVYVGNCNPEHIDLPDDIKNDKDFKVAYGKNCVFIENSIPEIDIAQIQLEQMEIGLYDLSVMYDSPYDNYSLNELYREIDRITDDNYILTEGKIWDALKAFAKKAIQIIIAIWQKIVSFFSFIFSKIKEFVLRLFGKRSTASTSKSIEVTAITFDGSKASVKKQSANSPEEVKNIVLKANNTIKTYIDKTSKEETEHIKKLEEMVNSGKLKSNKKEKSEKNESANLFSKIILI